MAIILPAFVQRHPRYTGLLVFVLLCSTLLLIPFRSSAPPALLGPPHPGSNSNSKYHPGVSLEEWVLREELHYQDVLKGRKWLIDDLGGDPNKIDPFPAHLEYTLWDFFYPAFNCPHRIERIGQVGDGGKWLCGVDRLAEKRSPCIIYSFGVNHDSSFEAALLTRAPNCEVWGYDFSVDGWGPQLKDNPTFAAISHFFPYALGPRDAPNEKPPMYTLKTLMEINGHDFIDVFKIDIEGNEFDTIAEFVKPYLSPGAPGLPIGQMQIEIHAWANNGDFPKFLTWWENLEHGGLRPFFSEPNKPYINHFKARPDLEEFCFINSKTRNALIADGF